MLQFRLLLPACSLMVCTLVADARPDQPSDTQVTLAAFLPDGKTVVTLGNDNSIRVLEFPSGKELRRIAVTTPKVSKSVLRHALSTDGKMIAVFRSGWPQILLYDVASGKQIAGLNVTPKNEPGRMAFSPDGQHLAYVTNSDLLKAQESSIHIWDWAKAKEVQSVVLLANGTAVNPIVYSPDGKSLAVRVQQNSKMLSSTSVVKYFNSATCAEIWTIPAPGVGSTVMNVSADGKTLAIPISPEKGKEPQVILVDTTTGKEIGKLPNQFKGNDQNHSMAGVIFAKDSKTLYGLGNKMIVEWDIATGKVKRSAEVAGDSLVPLFPSLSPDGKTLAVGGNAGPQFFDLSSGKGIVPIKLGSDR